MKAALWYEKKDVRVEEIEEPKVTIDIVVLFSILFGLYQHVSTPKFIPPWISEVRLSPITNIS